MADSNVLPLPSDDPHDSSSEKVMPEIAESQGNLSCKFSNCESTETSICIICRQPFCANHASEADNESCSSCTTYQSLETKREDVVDDDGVKHENARITPIGLTYRTLTTRISQMTDEQLEMHIDHVRRQVKEAETVLDYRRIDLAASQVELEERGLAKRKNLRTKAISTLANGNKTISTPKSPVDIQKAKAIQSYAKKIQDFAKLIGLPCGTPEQIMVVAQRLKAFDAMLKAKAQEVKK